MADEAPIGSPLSREELAASLVVDDPSAAEPEAIETVTGDEAQDTVEGGSGEETPPKTPAEEKQPGTPDKALQKLQQDQATVQRKLDRLLEKVETGESLTASEKKEVVAAQRKIDSIRAAMKTGDEFDIVAAGDDLAKGLVETDDELQTLKQRTEKLESELARRRKDDEWQSIRQEYAGVDTDAVWKKAWADAAGMIGDDTPEKTRLLASNLFHERCSQAKGSIAAKNGKTPAKAATQGSRISFDSGRPPGETATPQSTYRKNALALVRDDD